jgi:hypothetical protein
MARLGFIERGEDFQRFSRVTLSREKTAVSLHHAQRRRIELVGALEVLRRILTGDVENQCGVQLLEDCVPLSLTTIAMAYCPFTKNTTRSITNET